MNDKFQQIFRNSLIEEVYRSARKYIDEISNLIFRHFEFLFSEKAKPLLEADEQENELARFNSAIQQFTEDYENLKNMRDAEMQRILAVKNSNDAIDPEKANANVRLLNRRVEDLQFAGDEVGKAMNRVYSDTNEIIKEMNDMHKTLPKRPNIAVRMIQLLKNKFKS
jgi:signal transduction protein with GAF and PtsI domain